MEHCTVQQSMCCVLYSTLICSHLVSGVGADIEEEAEEEVAVPAEAPEEGNELEAIDWGIVDVDEEEEEEEEGGEFLRAWLGGRSGEGFGELQRERRQSVIRARVIRACTLEVERPLPNAGMVRGGRGKRDADPPSAPSAAPAAGGRGGGGGGGAAAGSRSVRGQRRSGVARHGAVVEGQEVGLGPAAAVAAAAAAAAAGTTRVSRRRVW